VPPCTALTTRATKRFETANVVSEMNGTTKSRASGWFATTGRTMPEDQLRSVVIWKSG
jgi:hypothetical protein